MLAGADQDVNVADWVSTSTSSNPTSPEYPLIKPGLTGPYIMPMPMPMPTLYNGDKKPKMGIIELVICNIGAMLASISMDFDVRLTNVSPIHPRLRDSDESSKWWRGGSSSGVESGSNRNSAYLGTDYEFSSSSGYAHNTYHGPAKHYR